MMTALVGSLAFAPAVTSDGDDAEAAGYRNSATDGIQKDIALAGTTGTTGTAGTKFYLYDVTTPDDVYETAACNCPANQGDTQVLHRGDKTDTTYTVEDGGSALSGNEECGVDAGLVPGMGNEGGDYAGTLGNESHDITFDDDCDRAYSAALAQGVIIDSSDPANPTIISTFVDPTIQVWHQWDPIDIDGRRFLFIEDEFAGATGLGQCPKGGVHGARVPSAPRGEHRHHLVLQRWRTHPRPQRHVGRRARWCSTLTTPPQQRWLPRRVVGSAPPMRLTRWAPGAPSPR
jgi:hypothetical protein